MESRETIVRARFLLQMGLGLTNGLVTKVIPLDISYFVQSCTKYLGWAKQLQWHGTSLVGGESYHTYAMSFSDDIILLIRLELLCW
jgi:hypothetical protein